jgi:thiosulfate/3-mercaptopyruvate sulfurtransferase
MKDQTKPLAASVLATVLILLSRGAVVDAAARHSAGISTSPQTSAESRFTGPSAPSGPQLIQPEELLRILKSPKNPKPLILQVGFRVLYVQAHVPSSDYVGPASTPDGIRQLRNRVEGLPRTQSIVLYCGCCPWSKCPNVNPAYDELQAIGFNSVKVLYIANNFGKDWVEKGYPVAKER